MWLQQMPYLVDCVWHNRYQRSAIFGFERMGISPWVRLTRYCSVVRHQSGTYHNKMLPYPEGAINRKQCITVMSQWATWRLKSPASRLFAQPFVQVHTKENIKAPRHWPLWGETTDDLWITLIKGRASNVENVSHHEKWAVCVRMYRSITAYHSTRF